MMIFPAMLMNFPNSKVCLIGEWSIVDEVTKLDYVLRVVIGTGYYLWRGGGGGGKEWVSKTITVLEMKVIKKSFIKQAHIMINTWKFRIIVKH